MASFEYIDDYLKGVSGTATEAEFEQRILSDKEFAEEVAFYLNTVQVARATVDEDKKNRFREIYYQENLSKAATGGVKKLWPYAILIAAVLTTLFVGIYLYNQPVASAKLADEYLGSHLRTLGIQMGNNDNLLEQGNSLYNEGDYAASLQKFEALVQKENSNYLAKENAGIAALKLCDYTKALYYFQQVADNKEIDENGGKFYKALTLMRRNLAGDKAEYKKLLTEVVKEDLFGKEDAAQFLKKLD